MSQACSFCPPFPWETVFMGNSNWLLHSPEGSKKQNVQAWNAELSDAENNWATYGQMVQLLEGEAR
jgi:hypothetical protein